MQCPPPALYGVGDYQVELLQNGGAVDPTASGTPITFELYDLMEVAPNGIEPRGGPIGEPATVTITGDGFRDMGGGSLVCVLSTNLTDFSSGAVVMPARLLAPQKLLCDIPASVTAQPATDRFGARMRSTDLPVLP